MAVDVADLHLILIIRYKVNWSVDKSLSSYYVIFLSQKSFSSFIYGLLMIYHVQRPHHELLTANVC